VISDILIRNNVLRRMTRNNLITFVVRRIKPIMGPDDVIEVELEPEVMLEEGFS